MKKARIASRIAAAACVAVLAFAGAPAGALPPGSAEANMSWTPGQPVAGQDATFGISARDPDGVIISATLEYGDGTTTTVTPPRSALKDLTACAFGDTFYTTVKHQYARPGSYLVRLTVVSGSCPLTDAVQSASSRAEAGIRVVSSSGGPAEQAPASTTLTAPSL